MAYELVNRLEKLNDTNTLTILQNAFTEKERKKKQLHKVIKDSFDAEPIFSEKFLLQKLNYIPARLVVPVRPVRAGRRAL